DDVLGTRDEFEAKLKQAQESAKQDPRIVAAQMTTASNEKIAGLRGNTAVAVATTSAQAVETAAESKAGVDSEKISSAERIKAVEIAVEDNRAAEARAQGEPAE